MKTNSSYIARRTFTTINSDDGEVTFEAGVLHAVTGFDTLINAVTGEVVKVPLHVARNPSWYFHMMGDMGHPSIGPQVTHDDYIREMVRGNEGLTSQCYWQLGNMEGWYPCQNSMASNASFTATLSKLGFEMHDPSGKVVTGIKHGAKNCTYHVKRNVKRVDGWAA